MVNELILTDYETLMVKEYRKGRDKFLSFVLTNEEKAGLANYYNNLPQVDIKKNTVKKVFKDLNPGSLNMEIVTDEGYVLNYVNQKVINNVIYRAYRSFLFPNNEFIIDDKGKVEKVNLKTQWGSFTGF